MPRHVHKSIAIGEMTRLLRNTESPTLYRYYQNKLIRQFERREYPKTILRELHNITHNRRLEALYRVKKRVSIERPLPFRTDFAQYRPSLNKIFRKQWQCMYNDPKFYSLLPNAPFTVFKSRKAMKSLLSAKRRQFGTERYVPNLNLGNAEPFRFTRFNCHKTLNRIHKSY